MTGKQINDIIVLMIKSLNSCHREAQEILISDYHEKAFKEFLAEYIGLDPQNKDVCIEYTHYLGLPLHFEYFMQDEELKDGYSIFPVQIISTKGVGFKELPRDES